MNTWVVFRSLTDYNSWSLEPIRRTSKRKLLVMTLSYKNYCAPRNDWFLVEKNKNNSQVQKLIQQKIKMLEMYFYEAIVSCVRPQYKRRQNYRKL